MRSILKPQPLFLSSKSFRLLIPSFSLTNYRSLFTFPHIDWLETLTNPQTIVVIQKPPKISDEILNDDLDDHWSTDEIDGSDDEQKDAAFTSSDEESISDSESDFDTNEVIKKSK